MSSAHYDNRCSIALYYGHLSKPFFKCFFNEIILSYLKNCCLDQLFLHWYDDWFVDPMKSVNEYDFFHQRILLIL